MTDTTKTRRDLVIEALANLGVLAAGQTPADEDFEAMDGHVDQCLAQLSALDIVNVGDADEIPVEWFASLAICLANDAAMDFGQPGVKAIGDAEAKLREMTRGKPTYAQLTPDYF